MKFGVNRTSHVLFICFHEGNIPLMEVGLVSSMKILQSLYFFNF